MISLHTGSAQTLTKLTILQEAVNVITTLEQQLRGLFPSVSDWIAFFRDVDLSVVTFNTLTICYEHMFNHGFHEFAEMKARKCERELIMSSALFSCVVLQHIIEACFSSCIHDWALLTSLKILTSHLQQVLPIVIWEEPCRGVPISYNGMPKIQPQSCPFPFNDNHHHLIHPSFDRFHSPSQMTSGSNLSFCHNTFSGQTN